MDQRFLLFRAGSPKLGHDEDVLRQLQLNYEFRSPKVFFRAD